MQYDVYDTRSEFFRYWVAPFYLMILNGNYAKTDQPSAQSPFVLEIRQRLAEMSSGTALTLLQGHWRYAIVGSWFAGLKSYVELQPHIGELLLASKTCYAGQSHAFALACFENDESVNYLKQYLRCYLAKPDCSYDQHWAIAALMWIDHQQETNHTDEFTKPNGLWSHWVASQTEGRQGNLPNMKSKFWQIMEFCKVNFSSSR